MSQMTTEDRCRGVLISLMVAPQRAGRLVSYCGCSIQQSWNLAVIRRKVQVVEHNAMFRLSTTTVVQLASTAVIAMLVGCFVGFTGFYHIHSYDQAFTKYIHNPTPENDAAFRAEGRKVQRLRYIDSLKTALLFFFLCTIVYNAIRRKGRLACVSLLAACLTFLAYVGVPSFPLDHRCCAYWGPGAEGGVSESSVQVFALSAGFFALLLLLISLAWGYRRKLPLRRTAG